MAYNTMSTEKDKARSKLWYSTNKEYARARQKQYYQDHKAQCKALNDKWRINNREKARASKNRYTTTLRNNVIRMLGSICIRCGFSDSRALQIDHVKGNGHVERKQLSSINILKKILTGFYPNEYQLLCANCNTIKKIENSEQGSRTIR